MAKRKPKSDRAPDYKLKISAKGRDNTAGIVGYGWEHESQNGDVYVSIQLRPGVSLSFFDLQDKFSLTLWENEE